MSFIVAGNWKMNKGPKEAGEFFGSFQSDMKTIFFVSSVNASVASSSKQNWGPQNIYPAASGAFTGETSPEVMSDLGASFCLVGHSERRQLFGESNQDTQKKVLAAQEFGMSPVLCIGETLDQRKAGETLEVLEKQLSEGLKSVEVKKELHIAYEPVWAIGTGEVATVEQVSEAHQFVRKFLKEKYPDQESNIQILYGGSVKPGNAGELSKAAEVGGFLVGGASLKPETFGDIIEAVKG